uniref:Uncharacterized protein n=1 Tax=Rhipicephalus zambeziensis TaxID=60191 RepID=A0A224YFG8_9ACAR
MTSPHIQTPCLPSARRDLLRLLPPGGVGTEFVKLPPPLPPQPLGPPRSVPCFFFFLLSFLLPSLPSALFSSGCGRCFRGTVCKGLASSFFLGLIHRHHLHQKSLWCFTLGIITFGGLVCLLSPFLGLCLCAFSRCLYFFFVCLLWVCFVCTGLVRQCCLLGGRWH